MTRDADLDLLLDDEELNEQTGKSHDDLIDDDENEGVRRDTNSDDDDMFFSDDDDDDDDEGKPASNKPEKAGQSDGATASDEEEDEDDEDGVTKPSVSPYLLGAVAVSVIALSGGAGYVMLNKDNVSDEQPMVTTSMPAPKLEDLGKDLSIPSTNLVDENPDAVIGEDPASTPVAESALATPAGEPSTLTPPVESVVKVEDGVSTPPSPTNGNLATSIVSVPVTPVSASQGSDVVNREELQKIVAEAVQGAVAAQHNEELKQEVDQLKAQLQEAKNKSSSEPKESFDDYKAKVISEIKQNKEKSEQAKKEELDRIIAKATAGKKRIPGFQVINATADGTFSIIKVPSGRTFTLFKGEKFKSSNGVVLEVKEIVAGGKLVVAGDNWYIDDVLEKVERIEKPVQSQSQRKSESRKEAPKPVAKSSSLSGWSFHASFEGGGYLVKSPSGEYKTVKKGTYEEGLGTIIGVDDSGNLKTEKGTVSGNM